MKGCWCDCFSTTLKTNWIKSDAPYPPSTWSVFLQAIRTNNDAEGWHNRLTKRADKWGVNFHELIPLLFKRSPLIEVKIKLLSQAATIRAARQIHSSLQGKLLGIWDLYVNKQISTFAQTLFQVVCWTKQKNKLHYLSGWIIQNHQTFEQVLF